MQLSTILAALTAVAVSASPVTSPVASPAESLTFESPGVEVKAYPDGLPKELIPRAIESGLTKRQGYSGMYACRDLYWATFCEHISAPWYSCVNIDDNLKYSISSIGSDAGYCLYYRDFNCQDGNGHFGTWAPGYSDLNTIGFNDVISSYRCNPN